MAHRGASGDDEKEKKDLEREIQSTMRMLAFISLLSLVIFSSMFIVLLVLFLF